MTFKKWFRSKGDGRASDGEAVDHELEKIQDDLEDELLADHLSNVLSRNVTAPPSSAPVEIPPVEPTSHFLKVQAQHLFEYHSVFHRRLWGKTSDMSQPDREVIADYLDVLANNIGYRGIYLGSSQILEITAHLRESRLQTSLLVEPWMSPFKVRRRDVRDLYIHLCKEAFSLLSSEGEPFGKRKELADEIEQAKESVGRFDLTAFTTLKSAVEAVSLEDDDIRAASLYMNMDYVLACCGVRGAMSRMAGYMDYLVRNDPFVSTRMENAPKEDDVRQIIGRSWMRLAAAVAHGGHDPYTTASEWLPNIWLDLRYIDGQGPNTAEQRGLVIPALSPVIERLPFERRTWRDDRYGEWMNISPFRRGPVLTPPDAETDERSASILAAMELLKTFGEDVRAKPDESLEGDEETQDAALKEMADRISGNKAVMEALSSIDDDDPRERSRNIAKAFALGMKKQSVPRAGTTAELIANLVDKKSPAAPTSPSTSSVVVLDHIGPSEGLSRLEGRAEDIYGRLLKPLPLANSVMNADEIYDALQVEFPWMREANQMVAVATARAERQRMKHWRLRPTLLVGPPGLGKTRWIRRVSELTTVPMHTISLAGVANTKSIIGSERGWASARPSFMAYGFLNTLTSNPIFHVDELDKVGTNSYEQNVQESMLPIIEPETSRAYPDIYLLGKLDLGWATFLFSANDLSKVSLGLRTRLKIIHVRKPSGAEVEKIVDTMITEAIKEEMFKPDEIADIRVRVAAQSRRIYAESGNLRDVQSYIENEVMNSIWKPKGPYLIRS